MWLIYSSNFKVAVQKSLEETQTLFDRLISYFAEKNSISLEKTMEIYYTRRLSNLIYDGANDIQYLDYKVLAEYLQQENTERLK
ncbi:hypothetical protein SAMN04487771_10252 [[Clostridium] aminophilum]|uniref:Uncharacterized protein n=1 Tax=[Clostridium] aminophilum TaxID=1526 RepID=A0A1I0FDH5_9FIRM|nr:hypothetical protein SAMN04487771_10252 [[Clostridium] aminophilum]